MVVPRERAMEESWEEAKAHIIWLFQNPLKDDDNAF